MDELVVSMNNYLKLDLDLHLDLHLHLIYYYPDSKRCSLVLIIVSDVFLR